MVDMCTSCTDPVIKDTIMTQLKNCHVLIVTIGFGMGIDCPGNPFWISSLASKKLVEVASISFIYILYYYYICSSIHKCSASQSVTALHVEMVHGLKLKIQQYPPTLALY